MAKKDPFADMPITAALSEWLKQEEWEDEIDVKEGRKFAQVVTSVTINDQSHRMFLEANETNQWFSVYLYSPIKVPPAKMGEMTRLINRVNMRLGLGRLACPDDDEANPVQFLARIDVEGGVLEPKQIGNLVGAAFGTFNPYGSLITTVALTKQSAAACWAELLEEEAAAEKAEQEEGPSEL